MVKVQAIPAPTDCYDHGNSTKANMTSLRAMFAAFDATMDAFHEEIQEQMDHLDSISQEASKCRDNIQTKSAQGRDIECPATFEEAIFPASDCNNSRIKISVLEKARTSSNNAVRSVLREEASEMEVTAKPSDLWLDKASAFDKESECQQALRMHSVPPLVVNNSVQIIGGNQQFSASSTASAVMMEEAKYYKDMMLQEASLMTENHKKDDDEGSVASEYSRGTTYSNYSTFSVGTASHRRRQRKIAAAQHRNKRNNENSGRGIRGSDSGLSGVGDSIRDGSITSSRQQVMTGSLPYVCVMLHDTYGLGETDDEFRPPVSNVNDLFVFGTNNLAYSFGETERNAIQESNLRKMHDTKVSDKSSRPVKIKGKASSSDLYQVKEEVESDNEVEKTS